MSAHQIETAFLSSVILYDDSDGRRNLDKPLQRRLAAIENRSTAKLSTAQRSQVQEAARRSLDDAVEQLSPEL